jgi:branched-subunit amino acid ABC-type transport system permease component
VFYPEASNTVIFVIMVIVLLIKPAGCSARNADGDDRRARCCRCRGG